MTTVGASTATNQVEQAVCVHSSSGRDTQQTCVLSWESLNADMLELIAERVLSSDLLHYVWFRAVCKKWRAATPCPLGRGVVDPRFHPRQWMMFPEGNGLHPGHTALGGYIRFLNIDTGIFVHVQVPCFEDHSVLDYPDGLLLLQRKKDAAICLLYPFTGDVAEFPPLASLCLYMSKFGSFLHGPYDLRLRMVHAAVYVNVVGSVTIMLALSHAERMAYASTGDKHWTHTSWTMSGMRTALPFRGSLYMVRSSKNKPSHIVRVDPPDSSSSSSWPSTPPQMIVTCSAMAKPYLVECNSELLLVGYTQRKSRLLVIRLSDLLLGVAAMPLTSIGDHTLFIGTWSMSVNSRNLPSVQGNSITFLSPPNNGQLRQYDLGRGTWSPLCDGNFLSASGLIPRPYSLVHHIVSCCQPLYWISGHIWTRHHHSDPCCQRLLE
ncbi:uncharacterized protein LOC119323374 [Triticum dicoccoides]|uniref:uncharacterized protein LOC119323374 n=1 Tax=Triticum dicoccoides TaxID=85692 RepID=UPI000E7BE988|nr:uncharacterized protein LOC119323374 [Triticum dicoccoides]XP_037452911.1 uncharacterized protein LOC119323374 [Triticum dicoccoides]